MELQYALLLTRDVCYCSFRGFLITDHFSGLGRAVVQLIVCLCACGQELLNEMTFDLDIWLDDMQ